MTKPTSRHAFLSEYLLSKAAPYTYYPQKDYTQTSETREILDALPRVLVEWRKTFRTEAANPVMDRLDQPVILDQLYTRDLLAAVPSFVKRTRQLRTLSFSGLPDSGAVDYLREAANCYIFGLFQGAVALSRSAMEARLRERASDLMGKSATDDVPLSDLLTRHGAKLLRQTLTTAHDVRKTANDVLHKRSTDEGTALRVFEATRSVLLELK